MNHPSVLFKEILKKIRPITINFKENGVDLKAEFDQKPREYFDTLQGIKLQLQVIKKILNGLNDAKRNGEIMSSLIEMYAVFLEPLQEILEDSLQAIVENTSPQHVDLFVNAISTLEILVKKDDCSTPFLQRNDWRIHLADAQKRQFAAIKQQQDKLTLIAKKRDTNKVITKMVESRERVIAREKHSDRTICANVERLIELLRSAQADFLSVTQSQRLFDCLRPDRRFSITTIVAKVYHLHHGRKAEADTKNFRHILPHFFLQLFKQQNFATLVRQESHVFFSQKIRFPIGTDGDSEELPLIQYLNRFGKRDCNRLDLITTLHELACHESKALLSANQIRKINKFLEENNRSDLKFSVEKMRTSKSMEVDEAPEYSSSFEADVYTKYDEMFVQKTSEDEEVSVQAAIPSENTSNILSMKDSEEEIVQNLPPRRQTYIRHPVDADGDCGYTAFTITRQLARELLEQHLSNEQVKKFIKEACRELLLQEDFIGYLKEKKLINGSTTLETIEAHMDSYGNNHGILAAMLDYDVKEKRGPGLGWAHPAILQALAHIQKREIHMWCLGDDERLIPHQRITGGIGDYDYACYKPEEIAGRVDLLFIGNNHFDRLEFVEYKEDQGAFPLAADTIGSASASTSSAASSSKTSPASTGASGSASRGSRKRLAEDEVRGEGEPKQKLRRVEAIREESIPEDAKVQDGEEPKHPIAQLLYIRRAITWEFFAPLIRETLLTEDFASSFLKLSFRDEFRDEFFTLWRGATNSHDHLSPEEQEQSKIKLLKYAHYPVIIREFLNETFKKISIFDLSSLPAPILIALAEIKEHKLKIWKWQGDHLERCLKYETKNAICIHLLRTEYNQFLYIKDLKAYSNALAGDFSLLPVLSLEHFLKVKFVADKLTADSPYIEIRSPAPPANKSTTDRRQTTPEITMPCAILDEATALKIGYWGEELVYENFKKKLIKKYQQGVTFTPTTHGFKAVYIDKHHNKVSREVVWNNMHHDTEGDSGSTKDADIEVIKTMPSTSGQEITRHTYIEVKSTKNSTENEAHISRRQVATMARVAKLGEGNRYHLFSVTNAGKIGKARITREKDVLGAIARGELTAEMTVTIRPGQISK